MKYGWLRGFFDGKEKVRLSLLPRVLTASEEALDAEYEPCREELEDAGLDEETLRQMDPDDRVAALEQASLDPYDYIYLAC